MNLDPMYIVASLFALVLGLVLHEFAHAWVGDYLGDTTARDHGRISLNPLVHIDPFSTLLLPLFLLLAGLPIFAAAKPVPFNPWALRGGRWGAALVAAAGPLTNLLIAIAFGAWMHVMPLTQTTYLFLGSVVTVNVALFIFNLIPLPPLDGSRVLYAVAPEGVREGMDRIESMGIAVIFVFVLILSYTGLGQYLGAAITTLTSILLPHVPLP